MSQYQLQCLNIKSQNSILNLKTQNSPQQTQMSQNSPQQPQAPQSSRVNNTLEDWIEEMLRMPVPINNSEHSDHWGFDFL